MMSRSSSDISTYRRDVWTYVSQYFVLHLSVLSRGAASWKTVSSSTCQVSTREAPLTCASRRFYDLLTVLMNYTLLRPVLCLWGFLIISMMRMFSRDPSDKWETWGWVSSRRVSEYVSMTSSILSSSIASSRRVTDQSRSSFFFFFFCRALNCTTNLNSHFVCYRIRPNGSRTFDVFYIEDLCARSLFHVPHHERRLLHDGLVYALCGLCVTTRDVMYSTRPCLLGTDVHPASGLS